MCRGGGLGGANVQAGAGKAFSDDLLGWAWVLSLVPVEEWCSWWWWC